MAAGIDDTRWTDEADIVIVGLGGAGISAALEALDAGASVIAIDRFSGGGATAMSGGVFYSGGGTRYQTAAGVEDSVEEMYKYLQMEVADAVSSETLRDFCQRSVENIEWLSRHGVAFDSTLSPVKTSYPGKGHYLYYSGNEAVAEYAERARPAQRGHRVSGEGLTGALFFQPLLKSALEKGLKIYAYSDARRLVVNGNGEIAGVEVQHMDEGSKGARSLKKIAQDFAKTTTLLFPDIAQKLLSKASALSDTYGEARAIKANKAVVLSAGGFVHNRKMVRHYAPNYIGAIALGSIGCDGAGIRLGQSVGAQVDRLANISAWRLFNPPAAFASGIVVNGKGRRFVSEDSYGAKIGYHIAEDHDGAAYIILDSRLRQRAFREALPGRRKLFRLQGAPALMGMFLSARKAQTIGGLAEKCGMDPTRLQAEIEHYNACQDGMEKPRFRKQPEFVSKLVKPPFYAIDISIHNKWYLCPSISLGGLVVHEGTGQVLDEHGKIIPKLYAAGKNAVGVSSNRYISGLSLADCIYSGRIAGRTAAS